MPNNNGLIYLASPYSHPDLAVREQRFKEVCKCAGKLMEKGHLIFCPIAHTHPILIAAGLPHGWEFWHKYDLAVLKACTALVIYPMLGWELSKGMRSEVDIWLNELKQESIGLVTMDYEIHTTRYHTTAIREAYEL